MNTLLKNFILFWNKESLGFLLSNRSFFNILKDSFPNSKITLLLNKQIIRIINKNGLNDALGLKENDEIITIGEYIFRRRKKYDVSISPTMKNFSLFNHLLVKYTNAELRIGFSKVNKSTNPYKFVFNHHTDFDWSINPDVHFSEISLQLLKPLGIDIYNKFHLLQFYNSNTKQKSKLIKSYGIGSDQKIIGINNLPEDLLNKWDPENLFQLISSLRESDNYFFYFIGETLDTTIEAKLKKTQNIIPIIERDNFSEIVKLFSISDLVVTCDSRVMHIAGFTNVNQISLFGVRNPFNWAPLGNNKKFISKSDLINDIRPEEVFELSKTLLNREI